LFDVTVFKQLLYPISLDMACLQFNRAGDAAQRSLSALLKAMSLSNGPSVLLRAVSPSTLLRTVSLSNGLSNGSWNFYEAITVG
jgi:hypothetical protein